MKKPKDLKNVTTKNTALADKVFEEYSKLSEEDKSVFLSRVGINKNLLQQLNTYTSAVILGVSGDKIAWLNLNASDIQALGYAEIMRTCITNKSLPKQPDVQRS